VVVTTAISISVATGIATATIGFDTKTALNHIDTFSAGEIAILVSIVVGAIFLFEKTCLFVRQEGQLGNVELGLGLLFGLFQFLSFLVGQRFFKGNLFFPSDSLQGYLGFLWWLLLLLLRRFMTRKESRKVERLNGTGR